MIIQSLSEAAETCFMTCYTLEFEGKRVDEFSTLGDIPNLTAHSTFTMLEGNLLEKKTNEQAPYDEKSARIHIRRLRELLSSPKLDSPNSCLLPHFAEISNDGTPKKNGELPLM